MKKLGIIICDRTTPAAAASACGPCSSVKGLRPLPGEEVQLVGYTTCGGCPGGNVEYVPAEMKKNGAEVIHLATCTIVGYPPCPHLDTFRRFIPANTAWRWLSAPIPSPRTTSSPTRSWEPGKGRLAGADPGRRSPTKGPGWPMTDGAGAPAPPGSRPVRSALSLRRGSSRPGGPRDLCQFHSAISRKVEGRAL